MTEPFLKWVGGKRQLLPALLERVPKKFGAYYEPFVGGGALFFAMGPRRGAHLSDINQRLIAAYIQVRAHADKVVECLSCLSYNEEEYYAARTEFNTMVWHSPRAAALFIYLNKTGYNGLYRENASGGFNVPFGTYKNPTICDREQLFSCSDALQGTFLHARSFVDIQPIRGDFVYFDPPYVPVTASSDFTSYSKDKFGMADQTVLRDTAWSLRERGVHVLLSNSSADAVKDLYKRFDVVEVDARRNVNSNAKKRGAVKEVIIT